MWSCFLFPEIKRRVVWEAAGWVGGLDKRLTWVSCLCVPQRCLAVEHFLGLTTRVFPAGVGWMEGWPKRHIILSLNLKWRSPTSHGNSSLCRGQMRAVLWDLKQEAGEGNEVPTWATEPRAWVSSFWSQETISSFVSKDKLKPRGKTHTWHLVESAIPLAGAALCSPCSPIQSHSGVIGNSAHHDIGYNSNDNNSTQSKNGSVSPFSCSVIFDPVTPWTAARQASLSITNSQSSLKLMSIESVMPSNHLILCCPLLLLPSTFPSIRVFCNESVLRIRWPKYWSFSFNISPSNECSGLISFRMDWLALLAVQGTLKSLLQHHSSKAAILQHSAFFIVQLSHPYMTTGKTIALTRRTFGPLWAK